MRSGMIRIEVPSRTRSVTPAATARVEERLEPVDRVEPLADEQVVGDEQRVEAELLDRARERLDAAGALGAVALPDVGGQEDPEPADRHSCHVPRRVGLSGRDTRVALVEEGARALEHVVGGEDPFRGLDLGGEPGVDVELACD